MQVTKCDKCSEAVPEGAAFCPACGAPSSSPPASPESARQAGSMNHEGSSVAVFPRAHIAKRILAGVIDVGVVLALFIPISGVGALRVSVFWQLLPMLLPSAYLLCRDGFRGKSLGKLVTGLVTYNLRDRKPTNFADSILRNWFLVIIVLPPRYYFVNLGLVLFAVLALVVFLQIVFASKQRLGDSWANTQVIDSSRLNQEGRF